MKVALAQLNPLVGDIAGNCKKIGDTYRKAAATGCDLVVFPELSVCGYPPKDLLLKAKFVADNVAAVSDLASLTTGGPALLVGFVAANEQPVGRSLFNAAALLSKGRIESVFHKVLLPTYDVFDERRYFEPGKNSGIADIVCQNGETVRCGVTICEDLWNDPRSLPRQLYHHTPIDDLCRADVKVIVNISASPFTQQKNELRERLMGGQAKTAAKPLIFVNQIGGDDELIFDGASTVFDQQGRAVARAKAFEEDLLIADLSNLGSARCDPYPQPLQSIWQALVLGTRDYVCKCGFKDVVLGLSGGIDSALTACIAVEALGADHVHGVAMPSRYSSDHSIADARQLAMNLGIDFQTIPIEAMHAAFEQALVPAFAGRKPDATEENVQARVRGNILMSLSNKFGWLLLTTGNKSELAVGYCTLYGDMCGGLAVISDVPKTLIYELARDLNGRAGRDVIPQSSITKPPSAELRPNQLDQDSLPPYDVLDAILFRYVEQEKSADEIIADGFDAKTVRDVVRKVDVNEYKRKQAATGLKVTSRAFGVGRRMPIAARLS